jgi:hypothetical protein
MRHQDLTINHILESWVYANASARLTATGFLSTDIGRVAYQSDTGQYWRLASTAPTWNPVDHSEVSANSTPANPTGTASTTAVMMGLAGSITPIESGKIVIFINGTISNNAAGDGAKAKIHYGIGTAPINGAALTGTAVGNQPSVINNANMAGARVGFSCIAVITGLTLGSAIWLDLELAAITGGTANIYDVGITAIEV